MPDTSNLALSNDTEKQKPSELPLREAYQDLLHPAFSAAGQTLSLPIRIVNVLLTPLSKWVMKGEAKLNEITLAVSEKVQDVPPEKLVEPAAYVAVPAMQAFSYSMDSDELKNLYANLLASAINADEKDNVHPAFVEIIKQMSPLDAKVLEFLKTHYHLNFPLCDIRWQLKSDRTQSGFDGFRFTEHGHSISPHLSHVDIDGYSADEIAVSIVNLNRLGLIAFNHEYVIGPEYYKPFKDHPLVAHYRARYATHDEAQEREIALIPYTAQFTVFGLVFCSVCLDNAFSE